MPPSLREGRSLSDGEGNTQEMSNRNNNRTAFARKLRREETPSERLLWAALRASQLCGLKFRRQHGIGPFFADLACCSEKLIVEIDGGYHELIGEQDIDRQKWLVENGWRVIRCSADDVMNDLGSVLLMIAHACGREVEFSRRQGGRTGVMKFDAKRIPRDD